MSSLEPVSRRSSRPDAHLDTALDRSKIPWIFDRRHVMACACHQHALRHPATPSLIHEHPDRTAYSETGSQSSPCRFAVRRNVRRYDRFDRMDDATDITGVAGLLADSSRATMLQALMDQRARTAGELARLAKIAPSTASQHLGRLTDGELLVVEAQGRHRYYRLANPQVAALLEGMMAFAPASVPPAPQRVGFDLRFARTCYDHLAGTIATALYDRLQADGTLRVTSSGVTLTPAGTRRLQSLGIDTESLRAGRRPLVRACLDWTERRDHLAGGLGAALLNQFRTQQWLTPRNAPRALRLTTTGRRALASHFDIDVSTLTETTGRTARAALT
jgi:DNA-binding transcriptional ArsR family regulator